MPEKGQVSFQVKAIELNRAEIMFREGQYLEVPQFPSKLGYEAFGIVAAIGEGVSEFSIGGRVSSIPAFSTGQFAVYGQYATVPAAALSRYPESLTFNQGASIWMQYITAYGALVDVARLQASLTVLITAASSSVGVAAIQIAKVLGATVIATTRGGDKTAFLKDQGADHVIETHYQPLAEMVMKLTKGQGVNVIFDPIGRPILEELANACSSQATIIEYRALDPTPTPFLLFPALAKRLIFRGYTLFETTMDPVKLKSAIGFINEGLTKQLLKSVIDKVFDFQDIQQAHNYMASNQQMGKIVISV